MTRNIGRHTNINPRFFSKIVLLTMLYIHIFILIRVSLMSKILEEKTLMWWMLIVDEVLSFEQVSTTLYVIPSV